MLSFISGTIQEIGTQSIVVKCAGLGLTVSVPNEKLFCLNQEIELYIYFHWNQENGPQLFGFLSKFTKEVFSLIISCSGIGPKIGLSILAQIKPEDFCRAILFSDIKALNEINGIGQKKAELMIMYLKDKVAKLAVVADLSDKSDIVKIKELSDVLVSLGYKKPEISSILDLIKNEKNVSDLSFDELLRKSLLYLSKAINL